MSSPQTPQTSHSSHVDLDTLADLQEDLLEPEQAAAVAAHLDDCAECRRTRDGLDDVRVMLRDGAAEVDGATPDDVVRRLDNALAAAATPATQPAAASATVTPLSAATARAPQPWRTRVLQAAAVFVLVAALGGIGYGGIRALNDGNGAGDASTASAGGSTGKSGTEDNSAGDGYPVTSSGRNYTGPSLRAAVPELLAGTLPSRTTQERDPDAGADPSPGSPESPAPSALKGGLERLRDGAALAACVANLTGGPVTPLAVDVAASFEKKPATIIVLPDPDDPSFVNAYAVAPDCPTGTWLDYEHVALP